MVRGGFGLRVAALSLVLALAAPLAAADTQSPVQGAAWADYEADAGAILAQLRETDPSFRLDFAWESASLYEVLIPPPAPVEDRAALGLAAPAVPAVINAKHLGAGSLSVDPASGATVMLLSDPSGFGVRSLPVQAPADPAHFLVAALPEIGEQGLDLQPHDLALVGGLRYTIDGMAVEQPLAVRAQGDLIALIARAPVSATDGRNVYASDLMPGPEGERVLLVQARGAVVDLTATGLQAILQFPEASLVGGAKLVADVQGREFGAREQAGVASGVEGLGVETGHGLAASLLAARGGDPVTGAPGNGQGFGYIPLDAATAAASAAIAGAAVLAALGLAGLWASGKHGLLALLAPLYARLQTDEVLANQTREAIYRHVVDHPGVNVSEVVKHFGLGWGATVYHLRVLERSHLLTASKQGRQVCYFQNGGRYNGQMAGISALRNDNAATVARMVLAHPGVQQREICRVTGLAQPTVSWHLQRLEQAALVQGDGAPRKRYHALPALLALAERGFVGDHAPASAPGPAPVASTAPAA